MIDIDKMLIDPNINYVYLALALISNYLYDKPSEEDVLEMTYRSKIPFIMLKFLKEQDNLLQVNN